MALWDFAGCSNAAPHVMLGTVKKKVCGPISAQFCADFRESEPVTPQNPGVCFKQVEPFFKKLPGPVLGAVEYLAVTS